MSIVLFFGASSLVVIVGFIFAGLTVRHHYLEAKKKNGNAQATETV